MTLVLDASTLLILLKRHGGDAIPIVEGSHTPALTLYEIGNALRTETELLKSLTRPRAEELLTNLYIVLPHIHVTPPTDADEATQTLKNSWETHQTYYDSAYLTQAETLQATLATEDKKLARTAAKNGVPTTNADTLTTP